VVFDCLCDYRQHRPRFLPPAFSELVVEEGATGEGTVVRFTVTAGGRSRRYRMRIGVLEPDRVLEERDMDSSLVTRYVLTPEGSRTDVTIETTWRGAGGIGGFFERMFAPAALERIYDDELARLEAYAREQASAS
jgi:hypothetical protein